VPERSRCEAMVHVDVMGHNMTSKSNAKCTGEFCFKVEIRSEIGNMKEYRSVRAGKNFFEKKINFLDGVCFICR